MTVESMLRLIAGVFVTASVLLGMFVHPYFLWFTVFVGLNLFQSAFTKWCPMVSILRAAGVPDGSMAAPPKSVATHAEVHSTGTLHT
jgi:hypothetical protein